MHLILTVALISLTVMMQNVSQPAFVGVRGASVNRAVRLLDVLAPWRAKTARQLREAPSSSGCGCGLVGNIRPSTHLPSYAGQVERLEGNGAGCAKPQISKDSSLAGHAKASHSYSSVAQHRERPVVCSGNVGEPASGQVSEEKVSVAAWKPLLCGCGLAADSEAYGRGRRVATDVNVVGAGGRSLHTGNASWHTPSSGGLGGLMHLWVSERLRHPFQRANGAKGLQVPVAQPQAMTEQGIQAEGVGIKESDFAHQPSIFENLKCVGSHPTDLVVAGSSPYRDEMCGSLANAGFRGVRWLVRRLICQERLTFLHTSYPANGVAPKRMPKIPDQFRECRGAIRQPDLVSGEVGWNSRRSQTPCAHRSGTATAEIFSLWASTRKGDKTVGHRQIPAANQSVGSSKKLLLSFPKLPSLLQTSDSAMEPTGPATFHNGCVKTGPMPQTCYEAGTHRPALTSVNVPSGLLSGLDGSHWSGDGRIVSLAGWRRSLWKRDSTLNAPLSPEAAWTGGTTTPPTSGAPHNKRRPLVTVLDDDDEWPFPPVSNIVKHGCTANEHGGKFVVEAWADYSHKNPSVIIDELERLASFEAHEVTMEHIRQAISDLKREMNHDWSIPIAYRKSRKKSLADCDDWQGAMQRRLRARAK